MKNCTVKATLNQRVAMRDGEELSTNIYLPDAPGPFPVLLVRTPYDASGKGRGVLEWPSRGFAYVVQDVRGRLLSNGEWYPWFAETSDGEDTLNWIAAQSWCNGNVAMYGGSYPAATQMAAALSGHPALKCITPCLICGNFYHTAYWGGALRWGWQTAWTLSRKEVPAWKRFCSISLCATPMFLRTTKKFLSGRTYCVILCLMSFGNPTI